MITSNGGRNIGRLGRWARELVTRHGLEKAALRLAAGIALAWVVAGAIVAFAGMLLEAAAGSRGDIGGGIAGAGGFIVAGAASATVTYPLVRWAVDSRSLRVAVLGVSVAEVLVNAAAIAAGFALLGAVGGGPVALVYGLLAFIIGLLLFGLPGLAMALPSSYVLVRLLRAADDAADAT
jgi:hypothetical protein